MQPVETIMRTAPVIPVLVIDSVADARPIAEALVEGGLPVLEVTLRTPAALEVIEEMARVPGAIVGAGTVLNTRDLDRALQVGAQFIVSPGLTETLARAAITQNVAFLPGVANASDIMRGLDLGLDRFKFFPAEASGGIKALKALAGPFGAARFCPTGGITVDTAAQWLAELAVLCVGGSWVIKPGAVDRAAITAAAKAATTLRR
jgi:2-dehydro-3-deoxyphosphogluconate aldolase/(4S)-4-hydroxy-2-oxoglutarate aldolase